MNTRTAGSDAAGQGTAVLEPPAPRAAMIAEVSKVATEPGSTPRKRPPRRLIFLVLALAAAGGYAWYAGLIDTRSIRDQLPWSTEHAPDYLALHGNVDVRQVNLAFKVEGRIASLNVDEGDAVAAGAVVATLDRRYFEDDLRLARAGAMRRRQPWPGSSTARGPRKSPRRGRWWPSAKPLRRVPNFTSAAWKTWSSRMP